MTYVILSGLKVAHKYSRHITGIRTNKTHFHYLCDMKSTFLDILEASIEVKQKMVDDDEFMLMLAEIVDIITSSLANGGRILFCGNGGSAADAQHIAAELTGRFYLDRTPLDAEALHVNSSYITAVANDYHFDEVYARLVHAKGRSGDVLVALSTSGNSANILKAARAAKEEGMKVIGMTGMTGGELAAWCDVCLKVPSNDTPRIQEAHITLGHIICYTVEQEFFGDPK